MPFVLPASTTAARSSAPFLASANAGAGARYGIRHKEGGPHCTLTPPANHGISERTAAGRASEAQILSGRSPCRRRRCLQVSGTLVVAGHKPNEQAGSVGPNAVLVGE